VVEFEVYRAITEGDLVGTHTHVKTANLAVVDIFCTTMMGRSSRLASARSYQAD
jgi:hypothetical protein